MFEHWLCFAGVCTAAAIGLCEREAHGNKTSLSSSPLTWLFNPLAPPRSLCTWLLLEQFVCVLRRSRVFSLTKPPFHEFALSLAETIDNCRAVNYALSESESVHTRTQHTPAAGRRTMRGSGALRTAKCGPRCVCGVELQGYCSQVTRRLTPGAQRAHFLPSLPRHAVYE